MLTIKIPAKGAGEEFWDEENNKFVYPDVKPEQTLRLEHSLVSIYEWESKWRKPFFSKKDKTYDETMDYIRCMTLDDNLDPDIYLRLTDENISEIYKYINAPMTATVLYNNNKNSAGNRETVTSELIYYWMIELKIPFECQNWHINRLMTLIEVCKIKNTPPKKRSKQEIMSRNAALNAARRQQLNTKG